MPKFPKLLALAAIAPFLLAFAPPEETGTTVSVSGGTGRYLTASGCARPRLVEVTDQQVGAHHQWAYKGDKQKRYGLGLDADFVQSQEKECTEEDCLNPDWTSNPPVASLSPYGTVDWKWFGLKLGTQVPLVRRDDSSSLMVSPSDWVQVPVRGSLRIGYLDRFYVSCDLLDGQPLISGAVFPIGIGGRFMGTDLWAAPFPDKDELGLSARVARQVGPVRLRLSGRFSRTTYNYEDSDWDSGDVTERFRVDIPTYAVSAGIDYRLPF